ncbi:MAG: L-rhamnose mutarotase [Burkholderiales bacterium]|nr:L-rhamnose mutarotase [Burkholderiales bacterium]
MKKYCLALDLIDNSQLIAEYENYHKKIWPEITQSIINSGILNLEIYRVFNRLVMIIETTDNFSFALKSQLDAKNNKVQQWETLMWQYQQRIPGAKENEKWVLMSKIFDLTING